MSANRSSASFVQKRVDAYFGSWVWIVVLIVCVTCAGLVWYQARQAARQETDYAGVRSLRQSRLDLTKGFLHLAQSDVPGTPFSREQGLALIGQASARLADEFNRSVPDPSGELAVALTNLRITLAAWPQGGLVDAGYAAELRTRFLAVEREADASDAWLRERLRRSADAQRREFLWVAGGAVGVVVLACFALLYLRLRGRRAALEAQEWAERFATVVEHLPEGLVMARVGGGRPHWNPAARALHRPDASAAEPEDYDPAQGLELRTLDGVVLDPADWPLARVLRGESVRELELRVRLHGEEVERIFSYAGARVTGGEWGEFGFVAVRDVTRRRRAEAELRALNAELERRVAERTAALEAKNRELGMFTYSVSHDLKAPLRGIDGYSRLLLEDHAERLDDEGRLFLGRVRQASAHMGQLIDDLLTYSRLERRVPVAERVALRPAVRGQLAALEADIETRGVTVVEDVPEELAARADPQGLAMALRNLLDNAIKFTRGRPQPKIEIGGRAESDGGAVLWVRDNGVGFDQRFVDRIFEVFQRLHRAEDYPGTGIGLAIVRKAMERMGGRVRAEGEAGHGAIFYLHLPPPS